jgi:hypothetical protein
VGCEVKKGRVSGRVRRGENEGERLIVDIRVKKTEAKEERYGRGGECKEGGGSKKEGVKEEWERSIRGHV